MRPKNLKHASREELASYYSGLTDEALRWRLHNDSLSPLAQEVIRGELARRGVTDEPLSSTFTHTAEELAVRGRTKVRIWAAFLVIVVPVNATVAWLFLRAAVQRPGETLVSDALVRAMGLVLVGAAALTHVVAMALSVMVRARWTWSQVAALYLVLYLASLGLLLRLRWQTFMSYFG